MTREILDRESAAKREQLQQLALMLFFALFVARYLRLFVGIFVNLTFKAIPVRQTPTFHPHRDVTVVIPTTFKTPDELKDCLEGVLRNSPAEVFVVTSNANLAALRSFATTFGFDKSVKLIGVAKLNKRKQILAALQEVRTAITVFADDDVFWPSLPGPNFLDYLLAPFENPDVGAAGPRQRVRRVDKPNAFWFLGCGYLERRVFNNITTNAVDGSISTLSGRTSAYRTDILRTQEFFYKFQNDTWLGRPLNSDDDKFLTRFVYSHGHQIALQEDPRAAIETTLEMDSKYLSQCLRWQKARWRGNFTVMTNESYWRSLKYIWGFYVIYIGQFQTPALAIDSLLMGLLALGLGRPVSECKTELALMGTFILCTKLVKLIPHFRRYPEDIKFIPASLLFSYAHGFLAIYSLFTLHQTAWGSQNLGKDELIVDEDIVLEDGNNDGKDERSK